MTYLIKQTNIYQDWEKSLKDSRSKAIIAARINRLAEGLTGNVEPVGEGVSELKIDIGPGYRIYFIKQANVLIVLLSGGDKSTQKEDIKTAKKIASEGDF